MELPKVYANKIDKEFTNVQNTYKGEYKDFSDEKEIPLEKKIANIFNDRSYMYKSRVRITTLNNEMDKVIVGKTGNALLTIEGEKIKINDIIDIKKIC